MVLYKHFTYLLIAYLTQTCLIKPTTPEMVHAGSWFISTSYSDTDAL